MTLGRLDHYSIRTTRLRETERFYTEVLGLKVGPRPEFKFPGIWLYNGDLAVVHVVGIDRADPQPLIDYLGEKALEPLPTSIHELLTHVVDEISRVCAAVQQNISGEPAAVRAVQVQAQ